MRIDLRNKWLKAVLAAAAFAPLSVAVLALAFLVLAVSHDILMPADLFRIRLERLRNRIDRLADKCQSVEELQAAVAQSKELQPLLHGQEMDRWGSPIELVITRDGEDGITVRVMSRGPDRILGTTDDVVADWPPVELRGLEQPE